MRCETACRPTCKCRCGGKLHGVKRGVEPEFFQELPKEDPHHAMLVRVPRKKRQAKLPAAMPLLEGL